MYDRYSDIFFPAFLLEEKVNNLQDKDRKTNAYSEEADDDWFLDEDSSEDEKHVSDRRASDGGTAHERVPDRKARRRKKRRKKNVLLVILACLAGVIALMVIGFFILRAVGLSNLRGKAGDTSALQKVQAAAGDEVTEEESAKWQEGWVKHDGQIYAYNEDLLTFLIMGIDKTKDVQEVAEGTDGGQADALFLLVLNPHDHSMRVIGINRNTMTDIDVYDDGGNYVKTVQAQIAVQHGFGNGVEESCEYEVNAVRHLFYEMPVNGYAAINMSAIIPLTDQVGGIDVNAVENVKNEIHKGEQTHLDGKLAFDYIHYRDTNVFGSADGRLERQKQFLTAYINKVKQKTKENISFPISLYQSVASQVVTDVSIDEMTYLVSVAKDYSFDADQLYTLQGETKQGDVYEEFYADEDALFELILQIFYEPVEQ